MFFFILLVGCGHKKSAPPASPLSATKILRLGYFQITYPSGMDEKDVSLIMKSLSDTEKKVISFLQVSPLKMLLEVKIHASSDEYDSAISSIKRKNSIYSNGVLHLPPLEELRKNNSLATSLLHGYVNFYVDMSSSGNCPRWLDEGLASLISGDLKDCATATGELASFQSLPAITAALDSESNSDKAASAFRAACAASSSFIGAVGKSAAGYMIYLLHDGVPFDKTFQKISGMSELNFFEKIKPRK